ncbi:hypothetical protein ACJX0J_035997, partial [Zea mays]
MLGTWKKKKKKHFLIEDLTVKNKYFIFFNFCDLLKCYVRVLIILYNNFFLLIIDTTKFRNNNEVVWAKKGQYLPFEEEICGLDWILAQTAFKELLFIYLFILHTIFKAIISLLTTLLLKRTKCYQAATEKILFFSSCAKKISVRDQKKNLHERIYVERIIN